MDLPSLVSSISGAIELGRLLVNERDRQKAASIQTDLTEKLIQAQTQVSQVLTAIIEKDGTIQALAERVRVLEAQQSERARYQLAKLGSVGQFFAYALRPAGELAERADEPPHFLCQSCFDGGKKGVLRLTATLAICPLCKTAVPVESSSANPGRQVFSAGIERRDW